jgi:hypothetical protein
VFGGQYISAIATEVVPRLALPVRGAIVDAPYENPMCRRALRARFQPSWTHLLGCAGPGLWWENPKSRTANEPLRCAWLPSDLKLKGLCYLPRLI